MNRIAVTVAVVVLLAGFVSATEPPGWVPLGNLPQATQVRDAIEVPGTNILVACGYSSSAQSPPELWRSTDRGVTWTGVLDDNVYPAVALTQLARDSVSGRIWVIVGGRAGTNTLYYSSNDGLNWSGVAGPSANPAVGANCIEVRGDYVYFGGTIVSPYSITLYRLHQTSLTWEEVATYPECDAITKLKWSAGKLFVCCRDKDEAKVRVFTYTP